MLETTKQTLLTELLDDPEAKAFIIASVKDQTQAVLRPYQRAVKWVGSAIMLMLLLVTGFKYNSIADYFQALRDKKQELDQLEKETQNRFDKRLQDIDNRFSQTDGLVRVADKSVQTADAASSHGLAIVNAASTATSSIQALLDKNLEAASTQAQAAKTLLEKANVKAGELDAIERQLRPQMDDLRNQINESKAAIAEQRGTLKNQDSKLSSIDQIVLDLQKTRAGELLIVRSNSSSRWLELPNLTAAPALGAPQSGFQKAFRVQVRTKGLSKQTVHDACVVVEAMSAIKDPPCEPLPLLLAEGTHTPLPNIPYELRIDGVYSSHISSDFAVMYVTPK